MYYAIVQISDRLFRWALWDRHPATNGHVEIPEAFGVVEAFDKAQDQVEAAAIVLGAPVLLHVPIELVTAWREARP